MIAGIGLPTDDMSETAQARPDLAPFCEGLGIDIGFGGDPIVPDAITFDMPQPYTQMGTTTQVLRGDCRSLPFICDHAFDWVYSSHLNEDFTYAQQVAMLVEWRRILKPGGYLITNCPDQQRFVAHCAKTGQPDNPGHKEADFSLETFRSRVLAPTGPWQDVYEKPQAGPYSWYLVVRRPL